MLETAQRIGLGPFYRQVRVRDGERCVLPIRPPPHNPQAPHDGHVPFIGPFSQIYASHPLPNFRKKSPAGTVHGLAVGSPVDPPARDRGGVGLAGGCGVLTTLDSHNGLC